MGISAQAFSDSSAATVEQAGRSVVRVEGRRGRPVSGIVWSDNRVVTVAHGLDGDDAIIGFEDTVMKARVKGVDASTGLALLAVDGVLPAAKLDDGAALKVGQLVLRLARPGITVRATSGIISALGAKPFRAMGGGSIDRWFEIDAAHHAGFSGGPVVTLEGQVVGLTSTALVRRTSLVVPTSTIRRVVAQLEAHGRVRSSHVGVKMHPVPLPESVRAKTGEEVGLLVIAVEAGSPAATAGLVDGDTVLHLGDDSVRSLEDLYSYLRDDRSGQTVPVTVLRGGEVQKLQVTLGAK
ncbi:MAG: PDZ domain-containing protein [Archangium sp.]|nr:PDZ domain-containing protein [Archangium sp.]